MIINFFRWGVSILILFLYQCNINAQEGDAIIKGIRARLAAIDTLLTSPDREHSLDVTLNSQPINDKTAEFDGIDRWVKSLKRTHSAKTGLDAGTSYEYKQGGHQGNDEYDEFLAYSHRVQASITWNITNSGLIGRKNFNEKANLLGEQKKLIAEKEINAELIKEATVRQIEIINAYYNNMVKSKELLYDAMIELQEYLVKHEKSTPFNMLELKYKRTLLQNNLRTTDKQRNGIFDTESYLSYQQTFNPEEIDSLANLSYGFKEWEVTKRILENEAKSYTYVSDMKIAPFARANYYNRSVMSNPNQFTGHVGVAISLPLSGAAKAKRDEARQRSKLHDFRLNHIKEGVLSKIFPLCAKMNENLEALNVAMRAEDFYKINIQEAYKAYTLKRLTIMELCQAYEKLLDCQLTICDLANQREQLSAQLLYSSINN